MKGPEVGRSSRFFVKTQGLSMFAKNRKENLAKEAWLFEMLRNGRGHNIPQDDGIGTINGPACWRWPGLLSFFWGGLWEVSLSENTPYP